MINVQVQRLSHYPTDWDLPEYATDGARGDGGFGSTGR